jgi:hypothetical protein
MEIKTSANGTMARIMVAERLLRDIGRIDQTICSKRFEKALAHCISEVLHELFTWFMWNQISAIGLFFRLI